MELWEFIIKEPKDVGILADLLEECGHPGAPIARKLFDQDKFPLLNDIGTCSWGVISTESPLSYFLCRKNSIYHSSTYFSYTEAIWAVINSSVYKVELLHPQPLLEIPVNFVCAFLIEHGFNQASQAIQNQFKLLPCE